ncbi:MAG TPA: ABC transporter permease [Vicinamibacterales bacterium]|nr:ABC transporter permease [Vicinamibacterales bacterium]
MSRFAHLIVRAAARVVPADVRGEWRREWHSELAWCDEEERGGVEQLRRAAGAWRHAIWLRTDRWRWDVVWHDIRHAARALRARPVFTAVSTLSLALGIGANVAIFTVVNGVLVRPLPFGDPDRVVQLANGDSPATLSGPEVVDLVRDAKSFTAIGAYAHSDGNVTGGRGDAERVRIARVSAGFFTTLAAATAEGRGFTTEEDRDAAPAVVVISQALANRYFGRGGAVGARITVNAMQRAVIGVMPAGFDFPAANVDVWVPLALNPAAPGERRNHTYRTIARLAPGVTIEQAHAEVQAIKAGWQTQYPDLYSPERPLNADVISMRDRLLGTSRPYLIAMFGAAGFVLLIACANVASLLLTYGESRRKDLAICLAMGASRARLASRTMAESVLLTLGGGALGLAAAVPASRALVALAPDSIPRLSQVSIDPMVTIFALGVSLLTGLVSGAVPLLRAFSDADATLLRSAGRSVGPLGGLSTPRLHATIVVTEIALAMTMLAGAGLLTRSLLNLRAIDLGFAPDHVITAKLTLPRASYDDARAIATVAEIADRVRRAPAVRQAAAMWLTPIFENGGMWSVLGDRTTPGPNVAVPLGAPQQTTPGYFETMGIPMLRGRDFTAADTARSEFVGIVNESFGRMLWGNDDPLGRRFKVDHPKAGWITVVGVVADTRVEELTSAKPPVMYVPHSQAAESQYFTSLAMTIAARFTGEVAPIVAELRRVVRETDSNLPLSEVRLLDEVVGASMARERFTAVLVSGFAVLAAILAGVGIYGVIAYGVAQRRAEIGVRMALGAATGAIVGDVLERGLVLAAVGIGVGLAGAAGASRSLQSVLVGVRPADPVALGVGALSLLLVVVCALVVPARRAAQISPVESLRHR